MKKLNSSLITFSLFMFCFGVGAVGAANYRVNLNAPNAQWDDVHIWTEYIFAAIPVFTVPPIIGSTWTPAAGATVPQPTAPAGGTTTGTGGLSTIAGTPSTIDANFSIPRTDGTLTLDITTTASSWGWDACYYYFTDSRITDDPTHRIPGPNGNVVPTITEGLGMFYENSNTISLMAATQIGSTIVDLAYGVSNTAWSNSVDLESSGILNSVIPTNAKPGSTPTRIYYGPANSGPYQYSRAIFSDGSIYYDAQVVPEPGTVCLIGIGSFLILLKSVWNKRKRD